MKNIVCCLLLLSAFLTSHILAADPPPAKPRLIVGIVVDQMRYDYITRYWDKFGEGGFKKLVGEGYNCSNTHYNYVPTYTGPGHASIYTGTTPSVHGIISNDWYDRSKGRNVYVTVDSTVNGVGTSSTAGKMSPVYLMSTTVTDELRLASNLRSKVIGVAIKDRSSILPAGHSANGAYWFEPASGKWISSDWYIKGLPGWVVKFNEKNLPGLYLKKPWTTLLPIEKYTESTADDAPYEDLYPGETKPVFPHDFPLLGATNYEFVKASPYGNLLTKEFALAAMQAEELGKDEFTDILAISFSSTDYVGHQFGTHAVETEDVYLRLDQDLADLIANVEAYANKENVVFFLTADHAAIPNIKFLNDQKIPAGLFSVSGASDTLQKFLAAKYGNQRWVLAFDNDQVYLDHDLLEKSKIPLESMCADISNFLVKLKGVYSTLTAEDLRTNEYSWGMRSFVQKGYYPSRSGDVVIILEPGYIEYKIKGTTHGAGYTYDTHVPLLFYGAGIPTGQTSRHINITDIAPTISQLLGIQSPSGCTGEPIPEVLPFMK